MTYAFYTLGCKVNQYETQAMERMVLAAGHALRSFEDCCDCYVINTCAVTAVSEKKSRNIIRRARKQNPSAVIAVCGCYPQADPEAIRRLGADVISGTADRTGFLTLIEQTAADRQKREFIDNPNKRIGFESLPAGGLKNRTRAMLKVEDGCRNFCTYCIIPYTRGTIRSMETEEAVRQVRLLAENGYLEIVVTGIELASWGADLPGHPSPVDLIDAICTAVPQVRIRLGSLEPRVITQEFCDRLSRHSNLCPQFHLSLQSGCDSVLKRMNRKYDTADYLRSVERLRDTFPGCAITTDLIVGFPGETEEEFSQTIDFIRKCAFSAMHIFPYSRRKGTYADRMEGHLPTAVKEARAAYAKDVAATLSAAYRTAMIGETYSVLFEETEDGYYTGHAPNYVKCYVPETGLHNLLRPIKVTALFRDGVTGVIAEIAES